MWQEVHRKEQVLENAVLREGNHGRRSPLQERVLDLRGRHAYEEERNEYIQMDSHTLGQEVRLVIYPLNLTVKKERPVPEYTAVR